jgi:type I restriction enzyme, S subunit
MPNSLLPDGWRDVALGELGLLFRGRGGTRADEDPNGLPCVRYGDLYTHHDCVIRSFASSIHPASAPFYTPLRAGDLVFAGSGETFEEIGKAAAYCDHSPAFAGAEIHPEFAGYAVNGEHATDQKSRMGQGSSVIHIGVQHLARMRLRLPPMLQQQRIADVLSTVDAAIEHTEALIVKTRKINAGLMHDLFTRGVGADGRLRPPRQEGPHLYKSSPLGWIPKEWHIQPIRELFYRRIERGRPGLQVMAVTMECGLVPRESFDRRVESRLTPDQHLLVKEGDIAYNMMRMWQGVLGRASYDCLVSPAYVVMTPSERIGSVFAEGLLSLPESIASFKKLSYGVVDDRLRLYARDLVRIELEVPRDLAEQEAIANRRQSVQDQVIALGKDLAKRRKIRKGLLHDLLIGRVSVATSKSLKLARATANV